MNNHRQLIFLGLLLFYIFGFVYVEPYIIPPVQSWIVSSGNWAEFYYFLAGLISVVVAPISLGVVHVVMNKSFGFGTSFGLFYSFLTIGQIINFVLARSYGDRFVNRFFPQINNSNIYIWLKKNINRNIPEMMLIHVGIGGDFLAYIFGLSKVKFTQFILVVTTVNLFSTYIIVSKNLSVGNNPAFLSYFVLSYFVTYIPLLIVFRKDLPEFWAKFNQSIANSEKNNSTLKQAKKDFESGKINKKTYDDLRSKTKQRSFSDIFVDKEG